MYCKNCGCKVNTGERRCSECGTDVSNLEYCGGFWGLVDGEDKPVNVTSIEEAPRKQTEAKKQEVKKSNNGAVKMMLCAVIILFFSTVGCVVLWRNVTNEKEELMAKYEKLEEQYELLNDGYDEINEMNNVLMSENEILRKRIEILQED